MTTTVDGLVSVKSLAKTFASGKTAERLLYHTLGELGLPSGRVRNIPKTDLIRFKRLIIYIYINIYIYIYIYIMYIYIKMNIRAPLGALIL